MIQSFKMAFKSIAGNKMRAFLTMLGIIIGVMALVILVSLVNGATSSVTDTISSLGTDMLSVTISDDYGNPVSLDDLEAWTEEDAFGEMAPVGMESVTGKYESASDSVTVYGTTAAYADIQGLSLMLGRFLKSSDVDNHTNVCVVSETLAEELIGYTDCLGEEISLNGMKYMIVGVLEEDDDSLTSMLTGAMLTAYIPYTSLVRLSSSVTEDITSFYVSCGSGSMDDTEDAMEEMLLDRFEDDEDAYSISSSAALEEAMSSITSVLEILLGGIAGISLIVGGIGIMNIMLVTVTERTREIGIRKAIGATRGAILLQFLIEAVVLCMMGCLAGIGLSWATLQAISSIVVSAGISFRMNATVVVIAVAFCFAIGILFGLYPANKAAKMKPIDALHYGG